MNARTWLFALLAVGLMAACPLAAAQAVEISDPSNGPGKPYLVCVGVGDYKDKAIHARPTADVDAKALFALLSDPKYLGVPADRARLFTSENATRESVVKAIEAGIEATDKNDLLIIALFGRGSAVGEKPCFFVHDTDFKDRAKTAITSTDLEPVFKKLKNQKLLFLMDVSYKGFDAGAEKVLEPTVSDFLKLVFGDADREDDALPTNRVLMFGNLPFREPLTKGDHSLFYETLAAGLKGGADAPPFNSGYEPDGLVTVNELTKYLDAEMPKGSRTIGKTEKEKELAPFVIGQTTSHYWITRNPAVIDKVNERLKKIEALVKDGKLPETEGKEASALLFRMPKLMWNQELRKDYQKLADGAMSTEQLLDARKKLLAGLELPRAEGEKFASKVSEWVSELSGRYIKPFTPGELTAFAIRGLYTAAEETLPAELDEALKKPKDLSTAQRRELLTKARVDLGKREDLEGDKAVDVALTMACNSLNDRYTIYTDREGVLRMASQLRGRFPGVGIQIRRDAVRDGLLVTTPIKGSPAYKAGIHAGDLITKIHLDVDKDGNTLPEGAVRDYSTKGMKTDDAVKLILGKPDTPVTLEIEREGVKEPLEFKIRRNYVMVETVHGVKRLENNDWSYFIDDANKIGYVNLTQFISFGGDDGKEITGTYTDLKRAVAEMKKAGMNGLIIDLRDNPGGYLSSAVNICDMFVGRKPIVTVRPRVGAVREYKGKTAGDWSFPVVVLVNGNSASASEIVSACLKDNDRAIIVGEKSYGKGSVQDVVEFPATGGELKYTIARYYPPKGYNIDKLAHEQDPTIKEYGVSPSPGFEVKLSPEELNNWYEYSQDLHTIPPPGKPIPTVNPAKDKVLEKGLEYLRGVTRDKLAGKP